MIDFVKEFAKHEKEITRYVRDRVNTYFKSECYQLLMERISRLNSSWDMEVPGVRTNERLHQSQSHFLGQLSIPLVKEQMTVRRSIFNKNFRADPLFSLRAIGNTPQENAINMQDLLESNNEQIQFRPRVLRPSIDMTVKWGVSVIYTEYCQDQVHGWRTVADPVFGSQRVYGIVKNTKNAQCYPIDPRHYFQNPNIVDCNSSDYRGHIERRKLSWLINRVKSNPDVYIKENVEKIVKQVQKQHGMERNEHYVDPQGRHSAADYDKIAINDIVRGQFQIHLDGNEDDATYYYVEMIGDTIIRFQDNPYDMNMNQYTVMLCEPRYDYWWGNTPAENSMQNENSMNLLMAMSVENVLESMKRYIFYNKNAIDPGLFKRAAHNGKIPVDVAKDVVLNNVLFQYQPQDTAGPAIDMAYRRIMEGNQMLKSTPDLNRAPSSGGPTNKTAYAAGILADVGNDQDADILEQYSFCLSMVGQNQTIILAQFLGNFGPILIRPSQSQSIREVQKANITGNWQIYLDTALQKSYQGEIMKYQNIVTWLLNLTNSGLPIQPNFVPLVKQVLKMGKFLKTDEVLPDQEALNPVQGFTPSQITQGQEMAGAGQEVNPQMEEAMA